MTVQDGGRRAARARAGLRLHRGTVSDRLQDGRSVRVDFELAVLEQAARADDRQAQQSFNLSFDLWEERFAVTRIGRRRARSRT